MADEKITRFELQREYFNKALARLKEALAENEVDYVRDAIVLRFEFTFEMAWKTMFRYLTDKGEEVAKKAWAVIPVAFESRLITDAEVWDKLRKYRNHLSHEYNEASSIEMVAYIREHGIVALEALVDELKNCK